MKLNKLFMLFGGVLMTGALLTSCSDDDNSYDVKGSRDNLAYFEAQALNTPYESTITVTPAGAMGAVGDVMKVYFQQPVGKDTRVSVAANPEAAQKYLDANGLDYSIIPAELLDFEMANATVEKGNAESTDGIMVKVKNDRISELDKEGVTKWFAAFTIDEVSGDGEPSVSRGTYYAIVNTDVQEELHLTSNDKLGCSVVNTPIGRIGGISMDMPYTFKDALNSSATITLVQDNSLIDDFNNENDAEYQALPSGLLDMTNLSVTVDAGETESEEHFQMSVPESKLEGLADGKYLVPFKISVTRADGTVVEDAGEFYLTIDVVTAEGLINDYAEELKGSTISLSGATCLTAENLKPEEFNGWANGYWPFIDALPSASFVVDLGETKTITGFNIGGYVVNGVTLWISQDNQNWTELGNTQDHTPLEVPGEYYWESSYVYVLYAGMPARYLKATIDVNATHSYWGYRSWGSWALEYTAIQNFDIYCE